MPQRSIVAKGSFITPPLERDRDSLTGTTLQKVDMSDRITISSTLSVLLMVLFVLFARHGGEPAMPDAPSPVAASVSALR